MPSLVFKINWAFVEASVKVTCASTTIAPDGSVTVPPTLPDPAVCPQTAEDEMDKRARPKQTVIATRVFNIRPPLGRAQSGSPTFTHPYHRTIRNASAWN